MAPVRNAILISVLRKHYIKDKSESTEHYSNRIEAYKSYYDNNYIANKGSLYFNPWSPGRKEYSWAKLIKRDVLDLNIKSPIDNTPWSNYLKSASAEDTRTFSKFIPSLTLPYHPNTGPGNVLVPPTNPVDEHSYTHDIDYSKVTTRKETHKVDRKFIGKQVDHFIETGNPASGIAAAAIFVKNQIEERTGVHFYPDLNENRKNLENMPGTRNIDEVSSTSGQGPTKIQKTGGENQDGSGSGGFGTDMGPNTMVPRPMNNRNPGKLSFHQVHRFSGRALRFRPHVGSATTESLTISDVAMVTPLVEIPWDRPFMYMTPRDYNSLPPGSYATNCRVKITARNPQISFETGSSATNQATLNHNKHLVTAIGLNTRVKGTNRSITASNMDPGMTSLDAIYSTFTDALYGFQQGDAGFETLIPASLMGVPFELSNYYCMWSYSDAFVTANPTLFKPGWPSLIEHIQEYNMNDVIGSTIIDETYNFNCCPLKAQLDAIHVQTTSSFAFATGSEQKELILNSLSALPNLPTSDTSETLSFQTATRDDFPLVAYEDVMERGSICKKINKGKQSVPVQPSMHIGMIPIPKMAGTKDSNGLINQFTDAYPYYEVETFLDVSFSMPNHFSHGTGHNVEEEGSMLGLNLNLNPNLPVRFNNYAHA